MGADGPGKSEIAVEELARVRIFCDDWEQASHNGDLVHGVEAGAITQDDATQLGDVSPVRRRAVSPRTTSRFSTRPDWRSGTSQSRWR